jgi:hypothetical protein
MKARKDNFLREAMYLTSKQARFKDVQADSSFKKPNQFSDKALHLFWFIDSIMVYAGYVTWKGTVTTE